MNRAAPVVVFDIDGTVANIEHRRAYVREKPKNWPRFNDTMDQDTPYDDIIWLARLIHNSGMRIVFASGRGEEKRVVTEQWLNDHVVKAGVEYEKLYMRPLKDYRPDNEIKKEILAQMRADGYEPKMVFDDRNQVVNMWREEGIRCLQVAPGDF